MTVLSEAKILKSLSVIVPTPWLSLIVALTGFSRVTVKVSLASLSASSVMLIVVVTVVLPAAIVSVPELAV